MQAVLGRAPAAWEAVLETCCGLDIYKNSVTACLLVGPLDQQPEEFLHTFPITTKGLLELRRWASSIPRWQWSWPLEINTSLLLTRSCPEKAVFYG